LKLACKALSSSREKEKISTNGKGERYMKFSGHRIPRKKEKKMKM